MSKYFFQEGYRRLNDDKISRQAFARFTPHCSSNIEKNLLHDDCRCTYFIKHGKLNIKARITDRK
jgi:hypothetical protein